MRLALAVVLAVGCGGGAAETKPPETNKSLRSQMTISQFAKRADALAVDMIGGSDGALKPDGHNDAAFDATVRGPLIALLVDAEDDNSWQWDTYTGLQNVPVEMKALAPQGSLTGGIRVFENGLPLNNPDGSFVITDDKEHHLVLYISDNGAFQPGAKFKLFGETPDHKIVEGPVAKF